MIIQNMFFTVKKGDLQITNYMYVVVIITLLLLIVLFIYKKITVSNKGKKKNLQRRIIYQKWKENFLKSKEQRRL